MTALLIIGVYCFSWWLCWKLAGRLSKRYATGSKIKQWGVFVLIAALPYYYYLYEKSGYDEACDSVEVYFPKEKIDFPESIVITRAWGENTDRTFFGWFNYLVAPLDEIKVKLDDGISQFTGFAVYPLEGNSLPNSDDDKKRIKENIRFGYFFESKPFNNHVSISTTYIYDFKESRRISSYSGVSYSRGLHTIEHFAFPVDFKYCEYKNDNFKDFNFKIKTLLERTFKLRSKRN